MSGFSHFSDSLVGIALCYFAAHIGFAGAILNPFTVGIAQGQASVPLFTGIEYRTLCWVLITLTGILFVLWYAARVKKNPAKSIMYEADGFWRQKGNTQTGEISYHTPGSAWITALATGIVVVIFAVKYPETNLNIGLTKVSAPVLPVLAVLFLIFSFITLRKSIHFFVLTIGMARVPYVRWLKWIMPVLIILVLLGFLLLIPTVTMKLSGF